MKTCPRCLKEKKNSDFYPRSDYPAKLQSWCKQCIGQKSIDTALANPQAELERQRRYRKECGAKVSARARKWNLKQYGLTPETWDQMLLEQGGVCAVCRLPHRKLCVDHDHGTGKVRGLLCDACNLALGKLRDSLRIAKALVWYLEKNS